MGVVANGGALAAVSLSFTPSNTAPCTRMPSIRTPRDPNDPSHAVTSVRVSMATPASRAICCRSALRNVSGWKNSSRRTAPASKDPRRVRSTIAFTATMRCTTPLQYDTGPSGPSQCFSHSGGTVSSIS